MLVFVSFPPLSVVLRRLFRGPSFGPKCGPVLSEVCRGEGSEARERETVARSGNSLHAAGAHNDPPSTAGVVLRDRTSGTVKIPLTL